MKTKLDTIFMAFRILVAYILLLILVLPLSLLYFIAPFDVLCWVGVKLLNVLDWLVPLRFSLDWKL